MIVFISYLSAHVGDLMVVVQSLHEDEFLDDDEELETAEQRRLPLSSECERPDKHQAVKYHVLQHQLIYLPVLWSFTCSKFYFNNNIMCALQLFVVFLVTKLFLRHFCSFSL